MNAIDVAILTFQFLLLLILLLSSLSLPLLSSLVSLDVYHYYHHHYPSHVSVHANLNGAIFIYYRFQYPLNPRSICFNLEPPPSTSTSMYLVQPPCLKVTKLVPFPRLPAIPTANIPTGVTSPRFDWISLRCNAASRPLTRTVKVQPSPVDFFGAFCGSPAIWATKKKPPTFHYNWLFHRDPSNGVLQSLIDLDSIIRYIPQTTRVFFVTRMYVYIHLAGLTTNPLDTQ